MQESLIQKVAALQKALEDAEVDKRVLCEKIVFFEHHASLQVPVHTIDKASEGAKACL